MYAGTGKWAPVDQQLKIPIAALKEIAKMAVCAWKLLPSNDA